MHVERGGRAPDQTQEATAQAERRDQKPADQDHGSDGDDPPARERPAAGWMLCSRRVEHVVPAFGAGLGDTPENVIPVPCERLGRQRGEPCGHQTPFGRAHAITSSVDSSAPSCSCALDRVAATVPSAIPSTSPISAYERSA